MRTRPAPAARVDEAAVAWADAIETVSRPRRTRSSPEPEEPGTWSLRDQVPGSEQRRDRRERPRPRALLQPRQAASAAGACDGRVREPRPELRRDGLGAHDEDDPE